MNARRTGGGALVLLCCLGVQQAAALFDSGGIISIQNQRFVDRNCKEFVFSGANVWQVLEAAAGVTGSSGDVAKMFSSAQSAGLNLIRMLPSGATSKFQLQTSPGQYNEKAWKALDSVIAQANRAGVKLLLPLTGNWGSIEQKSQYVNWAGAGTPDAFYTNARVKQIYKNHVTVMTSRKNSVNGIQYSQEPAIFAWELMNEPRAACDILNQNSSCNPSAAKAIQDWISEMANFVKQKDPNHLLTVGEEGFFGPSDVSNAKNYNPNWDKTGWAIKTGQDVKPDHASSAIDFVSVHIWVDNWQVNRSYCGGGNPSCSTAFVSRFINSRAAVAGALRKPLVISEVGKDVPPGSSVYTERIPVFQTIYGALKNSLNIGGVLKGVAFWEWKYWDGGSGLDNGQILDYVSPSDGSWSVVQSGSQAVQAYLFKQSRLPNCVPGQSRATTFMGGKNSYAGRKLSSTSQPHGRSEASVFATYGPNIVVGDGVEALTRLPAATPLLCAEACEDNPGCGGFTFGPVNEEAPPNCKLLSSVRASDSVLWSTSGRQTFWKQLLPA